MSVSFRRFVLPAALVLLTTLIGVAGPAQAATTSASVSANAVAAGVKGFDAGTAPTDSQLSCLKTAGYGVAFLNDLDSTSSPTFAQAYATAKSLGMTVVPFQGYYSPAFGDLAQATSRGKLMVTHAQAVGYPKGSQVFVDIEGNNIAGTSRAAQIQWVQTWAKQVTAAGYIAGAYVGQPQELLATDFNETSMPDVSVFWQSQSSSAPDPLQGYVVKQSLPITACGYGLDPDVISTDTYGMGLVGSNGGGTPARVSPGSAAVVSSDGNYHVFSVGTNHNLYAVTHTAAGWSAPLNLGGQLAGSPGVIYNAATNRYDVFAVGTNGTVYQTMYIGGWRAPVPVPGATSFVGGLTGVVTSGVYHVFGVRTDHRLYQVAYQPGHGWLAPQVLGGSFRGTPSVTYRSGRYDVFGVGTDGRIYQVTYSATWHAPVALPVSGVFAGGVAAVVASDGSFHLATLGTNKSLYQVTWLPGKGWVAPRNMGGSFVSAPAMTYQPRTGRYDVFGVGVAGALYQQAYQGTWGGFARVGAGLFI